MDSESLLSEEREERIRRPGKFFIGFTLVVLSAAALLCQTIWEETRGPARSDRDLAAVQKMYGYFVEGKLLGSSCVSNAKEIALDDVVYDASSDAMPHVEGAKVYHGLQGVCDWGVFLQTFRQPDYTLLETLHSGTGTVIVKESLTPSVIATNKTAPHPLQNMVEYKVKDDKLASMKVFWGEPHLFDSLFVK